MDSKIPTLDSLIFKEWTVDNNYKLSSYLKKNNFLDHQIQRLNWIIFENPNSNGRFVTLSSKDRHLAHSYQLERILYLKNQKLCFFENGEHFVDINFRNKGYFKKILNYLNSNIISNDGIFSLPNKNALKSYSNLRFKELECKLFNLALYKPKNYKREKFNSVSISKDEYIKKTLNFPRLNYSSKKYLDWRFNNPIIKPYNFYKINFNHNEYYLAYRKGYPGPIKTNVLSEIYENGVKPKASSIIAIINILSDINSIKENFLVNLFVSDKIKTELNIDFRDVRFVFYHNNHTLSANDYSVLQLSDTDYG